MRLSKAQQIKNLQEQVQSLEGLVEEKQKQIADREQAYEVRLGMVHGELQSEQTQRASAQRGLVPYVRSLEGLHQWLVERPELATRMEPIMRELGIWAIKLGYDPDKDLALSSSPTKR